MPARAPSAEGSATLLLPPEPAFAADEITVEADTGPRPGATSASLTVLPLGPELAPGEDLASVVDTATGTTVRRLGGLGEFAAVSLRGSTFRQVEVFLDGVPLNPDGVVAVDLSELPASSFERAELYRGFAPVGFGSAAIGGVLNLVTADAPPPTISLRGGSFGTIGVTALAAPRGPVETLLAVDQLHTEGTYRYFDDQGTEYNRLDDRTTVRTNNVIDRASLLGRVRFGPDVAKVTVLDHLVVGQQGLPGPISLDAHRAELGTIRNLAVVSADLLPGGLRVLPAAWWLWREEQLDDREGEIGTGIQHTADRAATVGGQATTLWSPEPWLVGTLTLRARHERYVPRDLLEGTTGPVQARTATLAALGADIRLWKQRITLSPAVQGQVALDAGAEARAWPTPRIGALVRPLPWISLKGAAGLYLRVPDLTELYGDHGTQIGNPDLRPESGTAWEAGVRIEDPLDGPVQFAIDAGYGRRRVTDLIAWVQNSQYTQYAINVGEAYVRSTEGAVEISLGEWVDTRTSVTWTLARNLQDDAAYANKYLPGIPELEASHQTTLHLRGRASVSHTWSYTGLTYTDAANLGFTAPRDLHSFALDLTPVPGFPTLRAEVLNAFDVRGTAVDRNPLDDGDDTRVVLPLTDFTGYPLPGRTFVVALAWADQARSP